MQDFQPGRPETSPDESGTFAVNIDQLVDHTLPSALASYRLGATLLKRSPDQVASTLRGMEPEHAREVLRALERVAEAGQGLARLFSALDSDPRDALSRKPHAHEATKISFDRILILRKESKVQFDMRQQGFESEEQLRRWYEQQGCVDVDGLFERHEAHVSSVEELEEIVGSQNSYVFGSLSEQKRLELLTNQDFDLVVSLGGDDTAKDISRYISEHFFLILNSDEIGSVGALASFVRPDFAEVLQKLQDGNFLIEEWPRLEAEIRPAAGGSVVKSPPAINEIEIGDRYTRWPFRGVLIQEGKQPTEVKGNGVIFSVPAGLTGWFTSESEAIYPLGHSRPRTDSKVEFVVRGRYRFGETTFASLIDDSQFVATRPGLLEQGQEVVVRSTSNHSATINVDSVWEHSFPRGSEAVIRQTAQPLKVISSCFEHGSGMSGAE